LAIIDSKFKDYYFTNIDISNFANYSALDFAMLKVIVT